MTPEAIDLLVYLSSSLFVGIGGVAVVWLIGQGLLLLAALIDWVRE